MRSTAEKPAAKPPVWGLLAEYDSAAALISAAESVRDAGYQKWDCYSPFPVHGLDQAMGVRRTILPWLVLGAGLTGMAVAIGLQWYVNSPHTASASAGVLAGYPLVFSGKPYWPFPAHMPVAFELTVLFSALMCFFGLWGLTRLPRFHFPAFASARFRRVTDDKFFLIIEAGDKSFDAVRTADLLLSTHSVALESLSDE